MPMQCTNSIVIETSMSANPSLFNLGLGMKWVDGDVQQSNCDFAPKLILNIIHAIFTISNVRPGWYYRVR